MALPYSDDDTHVPLFVSNKYLSAKIDTSLIATKQVRTVLHILPHEVHTKGELLIELMYVLGTIACVNLGKSKPSSFRPSLIDAAAPPLHGKES